MQRSPTLRPGRKYSRSSPGCSRGTRRLSSTTLPSIAGSSIRSTTGTVCHPGDGLALRDAAVCRLCWPPPYAGASRPQSWACRSARPTGRSTIPGSAGDWCMPWPPRRMIGPGSSSSSPIVDADCRNNAGDAPGAASSAATRKPSTGARSPDSAPARGRMPRSAVPRRGVQVIKADLLVRAVHVPVRDRDEPGRNTRA